MKGNIGWQCTAGQCLPPPDGPGFADKVAVRWVDADGSARDVTFAGLDVASNRAANAMAHIGVEAGDIAFLYLPKAPEVFSLFLGLLKHRAIVGLLFANFGPDAVYDRLRDSRAKVLVTKASLWRRIASLWPELPDLEKVVLVDGDDAERDGVLSYPRLVDAASDCYTVQATSPDTPSVLHYTSGSTGRPKGVLHVHGSLEHQVSTMREVMQTGPDDLFWCTADQAWVTGTTYGVIAPWATGVTQLHFGGKFDAEAWFGLLQDQRVTVWYTAPTALRMLMRQEERIAGHYDLSALQRIYSVGEPLNAEIIRWVRQTLGKEIYDTWFQTETGAIMIANRPGMEVRPGSMGRPVSGVRAHVVRDDDGDEVGPLRLEPGWSSMFAAYINMEETYRAKFVAGLYDTGDLAQVDDDGYFWFVGRGDDVINTSGHLVGPFEVESALLEMPEVVDVAVIGAPDELLYEKVVAFVTVRPGIAWSRGLEVRARIHVSNKVSPLAVPSDFLISDTIPKNRSGKIMRRVLRARYLGEDEGDTSTMEEGV